MRQLGNQRGMALIVGLILLALFTMTAVVSMNISRTGLDIVGNMQTREEVVAAGNAAIQETLSTRRMWENPSGVFLQPCNNTPNTRCYDINGDQTNDITVTLTPNPRCVQARAIPSAALNLADTQDLGCAVGTTQQFGVAGTSSGNSLCANSLWEVNAVAADAVTSAQVAVTEGAALRVATDAVDTSCP